ncbi:piggyBac transposable element-derived protein 4-like [Amphibalanus amphitrite]|uniref:piggyBac transposable element-derived protein 4-like n=1 Tax=Amphibalanus amphitrite TaxID=1232801 RepID=UPI001C91E04D|nr:piggyBac transposable element-derived protein 4-like [Amphibalanus amphitrite]
MPRSRGRKRAAEPSTSGSPRRPGQPLTAEEIQLLLQEDDSDPEVRSESDDDSDWDEEPEAVTDFTEVDGEPHQAAAAAAGTPGPSGDGHAVAPSSDSEASEDEAADRPAANFTRVEQAGGQELSRTGWVWTTVPPNHRVRARPGNIMRGSPGPKGAAKDVNIPKDAFGLFLPDSLLTQILERSNEEGERLAAASNRTHIPVTLMELRAFIGLVLLRGCEGDRRCKIDDLLYGPFSRPFYRATMTKNRFVYIKRILRFDNRADPEERRKRDKFAAIRDVFSDFNSRLAKFYTPSDCITVDETLRAYRGRCGFVIYMPNKPDKYGLLFRDVADVRSRYMLNIMPYAGKAEDPDPELHITGASNVVHHLVRPFYRTGRNVTADRFYSSVDLCEELLAEGLTYVGKVMANRRHLPEDAKKTEGREVNSSKFYWSENIMVTSYNKKTNKNVLLLSTQHANPLVAADGKKKPEVMLFYNETKGGVDTVDQMIGTYTCRVATRRWPLAVFLLMLDVAALNGWVICAASGSFSDTKHGDRKLFLRELGLSLVKPLILLRPAEGLTMKTRAAIENVLGSRLPAQPQPRREPTTARARCATCVADQQGAGYKRSRHTNVNKVKSRCCKCKMPVCRKHSKRSLPLCNSCDAGPSGVE